MEDHLQLEPLQSVNPYTMQLLATYPQHGSDEVAQILAKSNERFTLWSALPMANRRELSMNLAKQLENQKQQLATLITSEMGKPISESLAEIEKCAWLCRHYSLPDSALLPTEQIDTEAKSVELIYEPLGVLFAIMPWNFPFWQVLRFSIPTLVAGNTVVLKHAPNVNGCAKAIEDLFLNAGFPQNVFSVLRISAERSEEVIRNPIIKGVTLTGSENAGRAVAAMSGKYLKKVVLELGGSDAFILFEDADFMNSCTTGLNSRMLNSGQVCIAAKRFIVHESLYEQFIEFQIQALQQLHAGDPMNPETKLGPLARPDLVDNLENQVSKSVEMGAKIMCGGGRHPEQPNIFLPTLLTNVGKGMPVYDDETFGPVMVVIPFSNEEQAIAMANDSRFGLGCSIWTADIQRAKRLAPLIEAGAVFVNSLVKSDPRIPFGGIKNSGFGKELAHAGIKEFMNLKTMWINE